MSDYNPAVAHIPFPEWIVNAPAKYHNGQEEIDVQIVSVYVDSDHPLPQVIAIRMENLNRRFIVDNIQRFRLRGIAEDLHVDPR